MPNWDSYLIDTDTVETDAGAYTVEYVYDSSTDQPYDEGFGLIKRETHCRIGIDEGSLPHDVKRLIVAAVGRDDDRWHYERRSGAAIVRYMRLKGLTGATLVNDDYTGEKMPTADRNVRYAGVAWAPDDVPFGRGMRYVENVLAQWHAWSVGDVFGYNVVGPDGEDIDDGSCWGYYGFDDEYEYVKSCALDAITADVERRTADAGLVGAGFVGLI